MSTIRCRKRDRRYKNEPIRTCQRCLRKYQHPNRQVCPDCLDYRNNFQHDAIYEADADYSHSLEVRFAI